MALGLSQVAAWAALLFTISGIAVQFAAGARSNAADECKIERRLDDAYVTALYEHYPAMSGCISQERTSVLQEIHAVVIRGMTATSPRMTGMASGFKNGVDVIVKHNSSHRSVGNAVFVLVSALPTIWRIHSETTFNNSLGLFLVSRHSGIDRERRTKLKMRKVDMPSDPQQLTRWIRRKWSAMTTLMVMEMATVITLKVGIDPTAKEKCEMESYLPNVYASHVEVQETRGCLADWNEGRSGRDVHIIELLSPSVDYVNNTRYDVVLNIRSKTRPVASRHIVLVLKSHVPVHWHAVTHSLRGTLDIITDQSVDSNGTNTHSCRVAMEDLMDYNGSNLVSWTSEKYGRPISYTEAQLANQFDLIVDDSDRLDSGRSQVSSAIVANERRVLPNDGPSKRSHHDIIMDLKLMIVRALLISCEDDNINLTIQKAALSYKNVLPSRLSFSDVSCAATANSTHYIFSTSKHECGTVIVPSYDVITYRTAIVIEWNLRSSSGINRHNASVSSVGGADANPLESIPVMINISCDSPVTTDAEGMVLPATSNAIQFQLKIFRDALFHNEILAFPARISNQEIMYVEANIPADDCMRVNISNCLLEFVYPSGNEFAEEHPLIVNGCIFDESARWVNTDSEDGAKGQRFEFRFHQFRNISYNATLQCKLTVCAVCADRIVPGVPMCKVRKHQCGHPDSSSQVAQIVKSISKGPLELLYGTLLGTTPTSVLSSGDLKTGYGHGKEIMAEETGVGGRHSCGQVIRVEGLSTEIVVSIAFTAFIIGILLMASLWCIYVRTGPAKMKAKAGIRSISNSGDSTPSSTAPMTVHPVNTHRR